MKVRVGGNWVDKPVKVRVGGNWVTKTLSVIGATPATWTDVYPAEPAPYQVTPSAPYDGPMHAQLVAGQGTGRMIEGSGNGSLEGIDGLSVRGPATYSSGDDYSAIAFLSGSSPELDVTNLTLTGLNVGLRGADGVVQTTILRDSLIDGNNIGASQLWVFGILTYQIGPVVAINTDFVNGGSHLDPVGGNGGKNQSHRIYISNQTPLQLDGCNFTGNYAGRDVQVYGDAQTPHTPEYWEITNCFFDYHTLNGYVSIQSNPLVESVFDSTTVNNDYACIQAFGDIHMRNDCVLNGDGTGILVMADNITLNLDGLTNNCATPIDLNGHTGVTVVYGDVDTVIDTGPSGTTSDNTPTFTYHATNADQTPTFERSVDHGTPSWGTPTTSTTYTSGALADGAWTFRVRATDSRGTDPSPALRSITVSTGGGTTVNSIAALQTAVDAAAPGDVIRIADGTYGTLSLSQVKSGNWVEITAVNPGQVRFQTSGVHQFWGQYLKVSRCVFGGEVRLMAGARHIWLDHCLIDGATGGGYMGVQVNPMSPAGWVYDTKITGCKFQGNFGEDAIRLNQWADGDGDGIGCLIEECEITGVKEIGTHNDSLQTAWGGGTSGLVFRRNYEHDNRSQNFFVKDQNSPVNGILVEDNLFVRNTIPSPGFGQPSTIIIFGPYTGLILRHNTAWSGSSNAFEEAGSSSGTIIDQNVADRWWTDTTMRGTMTNNTWGSLETAPGGSWMSGTGTITSNNPGFNNTAVDDYRILTGPSAGRGVSWKPSDFHYGP